MYIVAGLGNPTKQYENTRHNVGFVTADYLAYKHSITINKAQFKASVGHGMIGSEKVILLKPSTYMNLSGESVLQAVNFYKLSPENLIIVYDDIDLPAGDIRIRREGSAGTHNGMRSAIYSLQTESFPRVRVGIGRPPKGWSLADFVLSKFSSDEQVLVTGAIKNAADAVELIISGRLAEAQKLYNKNTKMKETESVDGNVKQPDGK